jgi:hypothetical protein
MGWFDVRRSEDHQNLEEDGGVENIKGRKGVFIDAVGLRSACSPHPLGQLRHVTLDRPRDGF